MQDANIHERPTGNPALSIGDTTQLGPDVAPSNAAVGHGATGIALDPCSQQPQLPDNETTVLSNTTAHVPAERVQPNNTSLELGRIDAATLLRGNSDNAPAPEANAAAGNTDGKPVGAVPAEPRPAVNTCAQAAPVDVTDPAAAEGIVQALRRYQKLLDSFCSNVPSNVSSAAAQQPHYDQSNHVRRAQVSR